MLFTLGYERRTLDEMIEVLKQAGVGVLLDVRELPLSRRKGFSKTKLACSVRSAGVEYEHVRPLGNPKPFRQMYMAGDIEAGASAYRQHLHDRSYSSLLSLAQRLDDGVCLLCVEHEYERCHRAVIVESLRSLRPYLTVEHL